MQPANIQDASLSDNSYSAVRGFLEAVARSLGAERVCIISPGSAPECVTLVASDRVQADTGQRYESGKGDVVVPANFRGEEVAQLVVTGAAGAADRDSLAGFASAAGYILGHSREIDEVQHVMEESRVLHEMGRQFGDTTELAAFLDSVLKGVRRLLGADYANVTTVDESGTWRWLALDGYRTNAYKSYSFSSDRGTAARIMSTQQPVVLEEIGRAPDQSADEFPVHVAEGGVSAVSVPLMARGRPVGALTLGSRTARRWKPNEIQMASVVANGAAIAIDQARSSAGERSQRAFLQLLIESFPGILLVLGPPPEWRVILANDRLKQSLPEPYRSGRSIIGLTAADLTPGEPTEAGAAMLQLLQGVYDTGAPVSYEQYASESQELGTTYWNWTVVPVDNATAHGERVLMLIAQDITDTVRSRQDAQRLTELARARAEELDTIISHMADGVALINLEGEIVRINPAGESLLGHGVIADSRPELRTAQYSALTGDGEPWEADLLPSMRALKGETVLGETVIVQRPDGAETILRISGSPLTDSGGNITGVVAVFHDVTQEKLVERLKDEFLSIVSHELRTPLTAIIGYSDLMLRGVHGGLGDKQVKVLKAVRANADRLLRLINDLLDVSKLESGAVHLRSEPIDVAEVTSRVITQTRILASTANVAVSNKLVERPLNLVFADEQKLYQILENLIANAIKFAPGGTVTIDGALSQSAPDEAHEQPGSAPESVPAGSSARSIVLSVQDNGAGLDEEQIARIWDRFYQADTTVKRQSGGAGLGLTIVRNLVELHGGRAWATSEGAQHGSTFYFSLPVTHQPAPSPGEHTPATAEAAASKSRSEHVPGQRPALGTILVAEDDADQREIICELLQLDGFEVALAQTGDEALELAQKLQPSAIALDVILPKRDGWEVLQALRSNSDTHDIPVLIISVVDQAEFGRKLGADDYLLKPLDPDSLRAKIRRLVDRRALQDAEPQTMEHP